MNPEVLLLALVQVLAFLAVGWVIGARFLDRLGIDTLEERFGGCERALFAVVGGVAFAVALMVLNIVTGGAVFGVPGIVLGLGAIVLIVGHSTFRRPKNIPWIPLILFAGVLLLLYFGPALVGGSGIRSGDSPWHLGWSEQLLAGEAVPTGPSPSFGRNAYPWGWHAVVATLVRLVPGSDPVVAYEALHLLLLIGVPLAGAAVARRLDATAGWAGATAMCFVGGFGWVAAGRALFFTTPAQARLGADLVVASPNAVYELLPPALPREMGVVLLAACCSLLVCAARGEGRPFAVGAGVLAGLLGLVSVPLFVSSVIWMISLAIASRRGAKVRFAWLIVPALLIFALWAGPVVADYIRFGGFVDITPRLGKEWSLPAALGSWGLLLPAALGGVWAVARRASARPLLACLVGTLLLLAASVARAAFDWQLAGNATLLHQGRVWPVAHLLGAAFAGAGIMFVARATKTYRTIVAGAVAPILLAIAIASPALASMHLTRQIAGHHDGFVYGSSDYDEYSFVHQAAAYLGPDVSVRVIGSDRLAFSLFQFSGVRLAAYEDPRLEGNDLRIRFRDLAQRWDAQIAAGGFQPDYLVVSTTHPVDGEPLVIGTFDGQPWSLVRVTET